MARIGGKGWSGLDRADRYPEEMLEYLRLMMMTPEDTRGKPINDFDYSRTISSVNEAAVLQSLVAAVAK